MEDNLIDLVHDPDELSAVDALDKGVTDVLSSAGTQRTHDGLSSRDGALGTQSFLQSVGVHTKKLGG